jgi:hypothetical protein
MNQDISHLLSRWDYVPGRVAARRIKGRDGTSHIQMRIDLGLMQMHETGRPDGKRPLGHESYFEFYNAQATKRETENETLHLTTEDCFKLQQELIQFHHRSICLFELTEFDNAIRDANRNLSVIRFVEAHVDSPDLAWSVQQFQPQILMMLARARGTVLLNKNDFETSQNVIAEVVGQLRAFYETHSRPDLIESSGEITSLQSWSEAIHNCRPRSELERLETDLADALRREDYEKAAQVRDALKKLKPQE